MIKELIYADVIFVVLGILVGSVWNHNVMMFFFLLGVCLLSRYPKVAIVDGFIMIDLVDFLTFYVAIKLGFIYGLGMLVLGCWLPQAYSFGESPIDTIDRMVSLFVGLIVFSLALKFGMALVTAITLGIGLSMMLWALIAIFIVHVPDPRFVMMAVAKPILFNRLMTMIGCC